MFSRNTDIRIEDKFTDHSGHLLVLQTEKDGIKYMLGNSYAPMQDVQDQIDLIDTLEEQVSCSNPHNIIRRRR